MHPRALLLAAAVILGCGSGDPAGVEPASGQPGAALPGVEPAQARASAPSGVQDTAAPSVGSGPDRGQDSGGQAAAALPAAIHTGPIAAARGPDGRILAPQLPVDLTADAPALVVEGLLNGGFEWIADSTTTPPKYGAYWEGAFAALEGDPSDRIEERDDAPEGRRVLVLDGAALPGGAPVVQKIVCDPRWVERLELEISWRGVAGGALNVGLQDIQAVASRRLPADGLEAGCESLGDGWWRTRIAFDDFVFAVEPEQITPRLRLELRCWGPPGSSLEIDDVSARVQLPAVSAEQLAGCVQSLVRWQLELWTTPVAQGGLGLVDPVTAYVVADGFDVETGDDARRTTAVSFHSLHVMLVKWLQLAHAQGWDDEVARWTPWVERIVTTLLERHLHPATGLPRNRRLANDQPMDEQPQTVGAFIDFLLEAREVIPDEALRARSLAAARRMADTLLALQHAHDKDPARVYNVAKVDERSGVFEGSWPNWFGHMPNRFTPAGELDTPRRFNTAWAVVKRRSFWYHLLLSPAAVMAVHAEQPREADLRGVGRALSLYQRDWDAARYDLENDTDDHYGYHAHDLLWLLEATADVPGSAALDAVRARALELLLVATDHRLPRDGGVDDALWIQAVRLGTACAGDSPRAFEGLLGLYELPDAISPLTSGLPLYREAILELAANDFKGRQLTNGQFTESFFRLWEMVCICYHGTYQGDCRERPLDEWHGDVGDIFGGPPRKTIEAQAWALAVATPEERPEILARLGTILAVTELGLRRPFGYVYGLDPQVARQYELPEKYVIGLDPNTSAGFGYVMSWLEALPRLLDAR